MVLSPQREFQVKLTIEERVALLSLMQEHFQNESYSGMKEIRRTKLLLQFKEDEVEKFDMSEEGGQIGFNPQKAQGYTFDVPMGEWMTSEIRLVLLEKDREHELSQREIPLFEKFVMDYISI